MTRGGMCERLQNIQGPEPRQVSSVIEHWQRLEDIANGCSGLQNGYWRFGMQGKHTRDDLKNLLLIRGFYHKKSEKLARLEAIVERCDRGHLSYEAYNVAKLKQFVKDRGLKMTSLSKANKKQLVQYLKDADERNDSAEGSRMFSRFLELPHELRNEVYAYYFKALGVVPQRFSQPPLCRVSRELRVESLGLFYEHSTFKLSMTRCLLNTGNVSINKQTKLLTNNFSTSAFTRIKHLSVELEIGSFMRAVGTWTIDLTNGKSTANSNCGRQQEMQRVVGGIMARKGLDKLRKKDLASFRFAWAGKCFTCGRECSPRIEGVEDDDL